MQHVTIKDLARSLNLSVATISRAFNDKYDIRNFDDVVLGQGSLPMAVLQEVVRKWIDNTLAGKPADQLPFACKPRTVESCAAVEAAH